MKKGTKRSLWVIGGLAVIYILKSVGFFSFISTQPWWMYFALAGIIFSGYKFMTISRDEKKEDLAYIEEQGQVYMDRIEDARKKRSS